MTRKKRNVEKIFTHSLFRACVLLFVPAICGADSGSSLALAQNSLLSPRAYAAQVFTQTGVRIQFQGRTGDLHLSPLIGNASPDELIEHLASQLVTVSHVIAIDRDAASVRVTLLGSPRQLSAPEPLGSRNDREPLRKPETTDLDGAQLAAIKRDYEMRLAERSSFAELSPPSGEGPGITLVELDDALSDHKIERETSVDDEELAPGGTEGRGMTRRSVRELKASYQHRRWISSPHAVISPPSPEGEGEGMTVAERNRVVKAFFSSTTVSDDIVSPGLGAAAGMTSKQVQDAIDAYWARSARAQ